MCSYYIIEPQTDTWIGTSDGEVTGKRNRPTLSLSTIPTGAVGGLFATIVMTAFREPTARALPPTAEFLSQYLGGEREDYFLSSFVLHFLYGITAGTVFGPVLAAVDRERTHPEAIGLLVGGVYGLVLSVFGDRVVLSGILDMELATDESAVFHAGHLIYGLALGAWVGSRS